MNGLYMKLKRATDYFTKVCDGSDNYTHDWYGWNRRQMAVGKDRPKPGKMRSKGCIVRIDKKKNNFRKHHLHLSPHARKFII